jgi:hypothetical protein
VANETEYSNYVDVAAFLDANIAPAFRSATISPLFCHQVQFQTGSDSKKLRKAGTLTATTATESTAHTASEYTETSPNTLLATQVKVYVEVSDKAADLVGADLMALAREAGVAIAEKVDSDTFALADALNGGTAIGTTTADATPQHLLDASYTVSANNPPAQLSYILHSVQIYDVQTDILASSASFWGHDAGVTLMDTQIPMTQGFVGSFMGIPVYKSTNLESLNTNADWGGMCIANGLAFAQGFGPSVKLEFDRNLSKGVHEISAYIWFDAKEYNDDAGVSIVTDK